MNKDKIKRRTVETKGVLQETAADLSVSDNMEVTAEIPKSSYKRRDFLGDLDDEFKNSI